MIGSRFDRTHPKQLIHTNLIFCFKDHMTNTINELGQPIGFAVEKFTVPPRPNFNLLLGSSVCVGPIALAHVPLLYEAFAIDSKRGNWTYMPYGPKALLLMIEWVFDAGYRRLE